MAKITLALALALFWPVATSHCLIERVSGIEFFSCCGHEETTSQHQEDDCHQDACAQVEAGFYKTENAPIAVPAPPCGATVLSLLASDCRIDSTAVRVGMLDSSPPELPVTWQFSQRAAVPARAPSFVS